MPWANNAARKALQPKAAGKKSLPPPPPQQGGGVFGRLVVGVTTGCHGAPVGPLGLGVAMMPSSGALYCGTSEVVRDRCRRRCLTSMSSSLL